MKEPCHPAYDTQPPPPEPDKPIVSPDPGKIAQNTPVSPIQTADSSTVLFPRSDPRQCLNKLRLVPSRQNRPETLPDRKRPLEKRGYDSPVSRHGRPFSPKVGTMSWLRRGNVDSTVLNSHLKPFQRLRRRWTHHLTGLHVKLSKMPRAGYQILLQRSFRQRTPTMGTLLTKRVELVLMPGHKYRMPVNLEPAHRTVQNLVYKAQFYELHTTDRLGLCRALGCGWRCVARVDPLVNILGQGVAVKNHRNLLHTLKL